MLRNYLITALRSFKRNKTYAVLNILGLAFGIGCSFVLFSVIDYHRVFDHHLSRYDRIYRVVGTDILPDGDRHGMGTPHPVAAAFRTDYPELEAVTRVHYAYGDQINIYRPQGGVDKFSIEEGLVFIEPQFFEIFDVNWIAGEASQAMNRPNTVILSARMVSKFFGLGPEKAHECMGRLINLSNKQDLEIVGVVEDPDEQSSFPFTIFVSYETQEKVNPYYNGGTSWNSTSSSTNTFLLVPERFDLTSLESGLDDLIDKYRGEGSSKSEKLTLQPLAELHFDDRYGAYVPTISRQLLLALGVIAIFLIITASINFINLSTAQAANRAKEIGIRKAMGGYIRQLRWQFITEIAVITAISLFISLAIAELMFILLEDLLGYRLSVDLIQQPYKILTLIGLFVIVTLLSGLYPSFLLSKMNPIVALKSKINAGQSGGFGLRKGLVIIQFAISQLLIIGTIVIKLQSDYYLNKDVGFEKDAIISSYLPERDVQKLARFKQELLSSSSIESVSLSMAEPTGNSDSWTNLNYAPLASETDYTMNMKTCDEDYITFWGIPLLSGRFIESSDSTKNIAINRKIADLMGYEGRYDEVIGLKVNTGWNGDKTIVGVTENYHVENLTEEIPYVAMIYAPFAWYNASFKIKAGANPQSALDHYQSVWESVFPEYVADYSFYDQSYAERYENEINTAQLLMIFSVISILIGCLGLYGLVSFMAANKTKEIGVRKVLGASMWNILHMFSKEVIILLSISFVVSAPIAYLILRNILEDIPYRIELKAGYFLLGLLSTLVIAFLTISHRTISSARLNPATTLKDE